MPSDDSRKKLALRQRIGDERRRAKRRGANDRRVSRGRFRDVGCGAFRLDFDGGLGSDARKRVR